MRPNDAGTGVTDCHVADTSGSPDVHGWQPIDTAPKDGTAVLLSNGGGLPVIGDRSGNHGWTFRAGVFQPTHWMPLPSPPAGAAS